MLLNRKFNEDSKNVLKTVIISLQVGLTSNFFPDYHTVLQSQGLEKFSCSFRYKTRFWIILLF